MMTLGLIALDACLTSAQVNAPGRKKNALKSFAAGEKSVGEGSIDLAEKHFLKAYREEPQWLEPLIKLGALYFEIQDFEQSAIYFEKALHIDSLSEPLIYFKLGEIAMAKENHPIVIDRFSRFLGFDRINKSLREKAEKYVRDANFLNSDPP
ncbi:MAG: hypothetical protein HKN76_05115, partial [Saprospiraceae bacterium]|nr:hypothetical protein [Saprospiraceae bacterium]